MYYPKHKQCILFWENRKDYTKANSKFQWTVFSLIVTQCTYISLFISKCNILKVLKDGLLEKNIDIYQVNTGLEVGESVKRSSVKLA